MEEPLSFLLAGEAFAVAPLLVTSDLVEAGREQPSIVAVLRDGLGVDVLDLVGEHQNIVCTLHN